MSSFAVGCWTGPEDLAYKHTLKDANACINFFEK